MKFLRSIFGVGKKHPPSAPLPQGVVDTGETEAVEWAEFWDKNRNGDGGQAS